MRQDTDLWPWQLREWTNDPGEMSYANRTPASNAPVVKSTVGTILVPLDGSPRSERALPHALAVAERTGAGIVLVSAKSHGDPEMAGDGLPQGGYLAARAVDLGRRCLDVLTVAHTHPAKAIVDVARSLPDPLVVMGTHGSGGLRASVLGSVAEAVVRELQLPVVLIGDACDTADQLKERKDLVFCFDESPLAEAAIPVVVAWTQQFDLHPCVLEVSTTMSEARPDNIRRRTSELVRIRQLFAGAGRDVDWAVVHDDDVPRGILRWVERVHPAWIVMSPHGATGINRLVLGSFTAAVVQDAHCPVMAVHPQSVHGWWDQR